MPKRGRKFITEFLVPNLNEETFGARLAWVDYASSIFQIQWNHKAASAWKEEDCQVFMEWDKKRGHYRPEEKEYFTKSKQRFRAVLNKSIQDNEITQLHSEDKTIKIYFLGPPEAAPFDLKFDILKDAVDEKNIILTNYLGVDSELIDSLHSEKDQSTKIDYSNALKDHNYQNVEEHKISVSYDDICYDAITRNDMSLYNDEPNVYASLNMMGQTIDEKVIHFHVDTVIRFLTQLRLMIQRQITLWKFHQKGD
ncbi:uncharacterized protein [Parasteatoda tepidariorum]|uniref:uncharacterized protein isoform X2 n=1 Tax=Parasteatoda tepidariorum TaxID=114398 RepID=UPI001C71D555|nr:uncharacterized protein LOC107454659 isoform X2 [Parasteatoda tepidariorum]